jgi:hypothetical protein
MDKPDKDSAPQHSHADADLRSGLRRGHQSRKGTVKNDPKVLARDGRQRSRGLRGDNPDLPLRRLGPKEPQRKPDRISDVAGYCGTYWIGFAPHELATAAPLQRGCAISDILILHGPFGRACLSVCRFLAGNAIGRPQRADEMMRLIEAFTTSPVRPRFELLDHRGSRCESGGERAGGDPDLR